MAARQRRQSVYTRVVGWTIASVMVVVFLLMAVVLAYSMQEQRKVLVRNSRDMLSQTAQSLANAFLQVNLFTQSLLVNDAAQALFEAYANPKATEVQRLVTKRNLYKLFAAAIEPFPAIEDMVMLGEDGKAIIWDNVYRGEFETDEAWFDPFRDAPYAEGVSLPHRVAKRMVYNFIHAYDAVTYVKAVKNKHGAYGYGRFLVNIEYGTLMQAVLQVEEDRSIYIVDAGGHTIFPLGGDAPDAIKESAADAGEIIQNAEGYVIHFPIAHTDWTLAYALRYTDMVQNMRSLLVFCLVTGAIGAAAVAVVSYLVLMRALRPLQQLTEGMRRVAGGEMDAQIVACGDDEVKLLADTFNQMTTSITRLADEKIAQTRRTQDMKLRTFMAQINPHFVYNTLNSVIYLTRAGRHDDVIDMTQRFIQMLRHGVRVSLSAMTTLREEMAYIGNYHRMMAFRYDDVVRMRWQVDEALLALPMPPMILYPLVENSAMHGIIPLGRPGEIRITARDQGAYALFTVEDDGIGLDAQEMARINASLAQGPDLDGDAMDHIGISYVVTRLKLCYDRDMFFCLEPVQTGGLRITFRIPKPQSGGEA